MSIDDFCKINIYKIKSENCSKNILKMYIVIQKLSKYVLKKL